MFHKKVLIKVPGGGGTLQLKIRGSWLDSLGSEILVGKDILGFFKKFKKTTVKSLSDK